MSTATASAPQAPAPFGTPKVERKGNIVVKWITTTDHKLIGIMYCVA